MQNIDVLNLNQLLKNPSGKYTAYLGRRDRIIDDLGIRYGVILNRVKKFDYKVFKLKDDYLFYFKIPSEEFTGELYYDVFILFESNDFVKNDRTINNYPIKLFSNAPNFMFTYTYALNQNGMIIDFLKGKCSKLALTKPPEKRNPIEVYGFEKSVFYACRYILDNNLNHKFDIDRNRFMFNKSTVLAGTKSQEQKYEENKRIKERIRQEKIKHKKKQEKTTIKKTSSSSKIHTISNNRKKQTSIRKIKRK